MLGAFLATLLFSLSAVSANRTARILGGTEANFWRILVATFALGLWILISGLPLSMAASGTFLVSGVIGFGVGDLALFQALPRLGSRLTMLLVQCFAAPFAALMEWAWLGTHLTMSQAVSSLVILLGVALAIAPSDHVEIPRRTLLIGILFGLLAAAGQAGGAVISRSGFRIAAAAGQDVDGIAAAYQRILGGVAMALIAVILIKTKAATAPTRTPGEKWGNIWRWVIVNGLSGPALGVSCYQWALKSTPTGIVLPIVATTPIVIIPFAWFVEGERPSLRSILGAVVAIAGAVALVLLR